MLLRHSKRTNVYKRTDDPALIARLLKEGYEEADAPAKEQAQPTKPSAAGRKAKA